LIPLDSPLWSELKHAYGAAGDTPALLRQLASLPAGVGESEPWFSLWSSLAHQGDVYSASFAAVPHVVSALATAPNKADFSYFHFPAWVEVCRQRKGVRVPQELEQAYASALERLPRLVAEAAVETWSPEFLSCALAAIAAAKGYPAVAEAALELDTDVANEFMEWFRDRQTTQRADGADLSRPATTTRLAASGRDDDDHPMLRLMQVEAFLEEHREAVRAVAAAMASVGREPGEYTAEVSPVGKGLLEVYARHDRHPADWTGRGDPCGRCCVVRYNPRSGAVSRLVGIR